MWQVEEDQKKETYEFSLAAVVSEFDSSPSDSPTVQIVREYEGVSNMLRAWNDSVSSAYTSTVQAQETTPALGEISFDLGLGAGDEEEEDEERLGDASESELYSRAVGPGASASYGGGHSMNRSSSAAGAAGGFSSAAGAAGGFPISRSGESRHPLIQNSRDAVKAARVASKTASSSRNVQRALDLDEVDEYALPGASGGEGSIRKGKKPRTTVTTANHEVLEALQESRDRREQADLRRAENKERRAEERAEREEKRAADRAEREERRAAEAKVREAAAEKLSKEISDSLKNSSNFLTSLVGMIQEQKK